jgi:tRNA (guanine-N7-)-methyltransferase
MRTPELPTHYQALLERRREVVAEKLQSILPPSASAFTWEVGCGHGHFLTAYATAHPDRLCIGVDIESARIERAEKKRIRAALPNLHFIHAEARLFLQALPSHGRIHEVFVLFPDPWPKSRHHKHRLLQPGFLETLALHTTPDARIFFRTDHREYFTEGVAAITRSIYWEKCDTPWPFEFETVFQSRASTHYSVVTRKRPTKS